MTSVVTINNNFEENLEINITVDNGVFNTDGQTFIIQHYDTLQNVTHLTSYDHTVYGENNTNYLSIEYRWTFDNITWSPYITMPSNFSNFLDPNIQTKIWLQVRYTYNSTDNIVVELKELNIFGTRKIYQPVALLPNTPVVYTNQDTYKVFKLTDFKIYLKTGLETDLKLYFRFTQTQGRIWSQWTPLTTANLIATKVERLKFCNFQFSFENTASYEVNLFDLELLGEFQNITANYKTIAKMGLKTQCNPLLTGADTDVDGCCDSCVPCSEALTPWNPDPSDCSSKNDFVQINDKNLWAPQIQLYDQLNSFIQNTNSWKCTYILTDPDGKGIDHILHEQQIHNMISMKEFNVIVPDNQFPVDNMSFSGFDLDLIQSFEIHIMKSAFKNMFGVEFRPSKRDIVYLCDINQVWEVEQMFPKKGFMNAEAYYRVMMKKYSEKASRQAANTTDGQASRAFLDSITKNTSLDALFFGDVQNEVKKSTKDDKDIVDNASQQYTQKTIMSIVKNINLNKAAYVVSDIWNASLIVSKNQYKMSIKSKSLKLVEYNHTDKILGKADNRAISLWFKTEQYDPTFDWTLFSNYDYTNSLGYKLTIFQGALTFTLNNNSYSIPVGNMGSDKWYSILVNMDQIQQKLELVIYTRQSETGKELTNSKLVLVNKMIFDIVPTVFTHTETMFIGGCDTFNPQGNNKNWYITNIRLYNQVIDKDNKMNLLSSITVDDAHLTILVDNCEEHFQLPNYSNY